MKVGDGIYQLSVRTLSELIDESYYYFGWQHEATAMIQKAQNRIIHATRNLRGGYFHFLSDLYSLYYGLLINTIETLLSW